MYDFHLLDLTGSQPFDLFFSIGFFISLNIFGFSAVSFFLSGVNHD